MELKEEIDVRLDEIYNDLAGGCADIEDLKKLIDKVKDLSEVLDEQDSQTCPNCQRT